MKTRCGFRGWVTTDYPTGRSGPPRLYGSRLPAYFHFDARATRRRGNWRFFVEVVNLTTPMSGSGARRNRTMRLFPETDAAG